MRVQQARRERELFSGKAARMTGNSSTGVRSRIVETPPIWNVARYGIKEVSCSLRKSTTLNKHRDHFTNPPLAIV